LEPVDGDARTYRVRFSPFAIDEPDPTLGPFERGGAGIGVLIETHGTLLMGYLAVGRSATRAGESEFARLTLLTEHPELPAGDVVEVSDGSRRIGSATILARWEPRQGSAMLDR
jgi:hypothetical protein